MTDQQMPPEADRLFALTQRSPFASEVHLSDVSGTIGEQSSPVTVPASIMDDLYFPPSLISIIRGGAANGDFAAGPDDDTAVIDDIENKLPGWSLVTVQGTDLYVTRVVATDNPGGYAMRFHLNSGLGVASDEMYLETFVPASGQTRFLTPTVRVEDAATSTFDFKLSYQFVKADFTTTTGTEITQTFSGGASPAEFIIRHWAVPPDDAAYLRVRLGVVVQASAVGDRTWDIDYFWSEPQALYFATLWGERDADFTASVENPIGFGSTNLLAAPRWFVAPRPGFVLGVGSMLETFSAGSMTVRVEWGNSGAGSVFMTPVATHTADAASATQSLHGAGNLVATGTFPFPAGAELRLSGKPDASFSPLTSDITAHATLAMFDDD